MDAIHATLREALMEALLEETLASVRKVTTLVREAEAATARARHARAGELFERALAVAEAELEPDSLVQAYLLELLLCTRAWRFMTMPGTRDDFVAGVRPVARVLQAVWRDDAAMLPLAHRALTLLHARWRAGNLRRAAC
jgi:hypothetical protein